MRSSLPRAGHGIVLNPGGYAHYSVAILDALQCSVPAVEVMLDAPTSASPSAKRTWCPLAVRVILWRRPAGLPARLHLAGAAAAH